jgi:hypothetical protein
MNRLLACSCEISVLVSTLDKPAIIEIFQALHSEVQYSSELFFAFCSLLSIALDGFSGYKRHATGACSFYWPSQKPLYGQMLLNFPRSLRKAS